MLLRGEWTGHRRWEERLRLQPGTLIPQLFTRERNALATLGRLSADDLWAQAGAAHVGAQLGEGGHLSRGHEPLAPRVLLDEPSQRWAIAG